MTPGLPRHPTRLGVLSNPLSGGNRRRMAKIDDLLAGRPEVLHCTARDPGEVTEALGRLAAAGTNVLALNAGDGTIQCALTALEAGAAFAVPPLLAVLKAGTTSMTAGDVGMPGSNTKALARLLRWVGNSGPRGRILRRPVLRVQLGSGAPLCGMFFGAGIIYQGIEFFHRRVNPVGVRGEIGPGLTILRFLWAVIRKDTRYAEPFRGGISLDGSPSMHQDYLFLLVSALDRLFLGMRPFFGGGRGPLHCTAVTRQPRHLLWTAPLLAFGRPCAHGTAANGYHGGNAHEVRLEMDGGFTLDGELHRASRAAGPLVIRSAGPMNFLQV